jgi:hypothetical protein
MTWIARISSIAGLSVFFARAVGYLWPGARAGIGQSATIVLPLLVLTWINVMGVKSGARTAVVLAWGKVLPLVLFVAVGLFFVEWTRVFPVPTPEPGNFTKAALLVLFAYAGFENTPAPAGEFVNPKRDVPFALVVQIAIVTAIYTTVQLVAIGTVPNLGASPTPLADAAAMMMGPVGGLILTLGAVLSVLGTNNNTVLAGPRYLYALAETAVRFREDSSAVPHAPRRDPHADRRRAPPRPDRHGGGARRPLGHRSARDLHRDRRRGAGSPAEDARHGKDDPPAGRAAHPDRRARHLPAVSLGSREEELDRRRNRPRGRSPRLPRPLGRSPAAGLIRGRPVCPSEAACG